MKKSIFAYCLAWIITVGSYLGHVYDLQLLNITLVGFYILLPITSIVCAASIAKRGCPLWGGVIISLVMGYACSLSYHLTFGFDPNPWLLAFDSLVIHGASISFLGFIIGFILRRLWRR